MPARNELGPLWDAEGKYSGFRVSIPDPSDLIEWAIRYASESGDLTEAQIVDRNKNFLKEQIERAYIFGDDIYKILHNERVWKIDTKDELFSYAITELSANYSSQSGPFAHMISHLEFSEDAVEQNIHYHVSSSTPEISSNLRKKGFKCITERYKGENAIVISRGEGSPKFYIGLFYESPEEALSAYPDEPLTEWSIVFHHTEVPLEYLEK